MGFRGCEKCNYTGFILIQRKIKGYPDFVDFCNKCECTFRESKEQHIPVNIQNEKWNDKGYDRSWQRIGKEFLENDNLRILLIWGKTQVGKTFLSHRIREYYAYRNGWSYTEFIKAMELTHSQFGNYVYLQDSENKLKSADFIVIDDFFCSDKFINYDFVSELEIFLDELQASKIIITMNGDPDINMQQKVPSIYKRLQKKAAWYEMKKE